MFCKLKSIAQNKASWNKYWTTKTQLALNLSRIKANSMQIKLSYLQIVFEFDNVLTK